MNSSTQKPSVGSSGDFEETLRLIARVSAPEGLEERVQTGLRKAKSTSSGKARILAWPVALRLDSAWSQSNLARTAAAAAIVAVVVGGGWRISSRFQPAQPSSANAVPAHSTNQGSFSSAGAMRTPQTLNGPIVTATAAAHPAAAVTQPAKHAALSKHHRGAPASVKKPTTPTTR